MPSVPYLAYTSSTEGAMLGTTFLNLATALGLGLLVGLQKERAASPLAGLKTFGLVSVAGAVAALVGQASTPWVIVGGLVAITALMITGNLLMAKSGDAQPGQTTEAAAVVVYLVGALVVIGPREAAIVLGAAVAVLLHMREELKDWVGRLSDRDVRAIMQFVLISLVILPILPDRAYGPYEVLNPREIWLMVVLIVGINLAGYGAFRVMGSRTGTALAGILGGAISSTATTVSYARTTRIDEDATQTAVVVVWVASSVVFVRLLLEIGAVAPEFLPIAAGPLAAMLVVFAALASLVWRSATGPGESPLEPGNPTELKPAIVFGLLYAGVLLAIAAADDLLGEVGLYAAAVVSGLADVDAITLSTSQLVSDGRLASSTGWRVVLIAVLSNLVFKLGLAITLGSRAFARRLSMLGGVAIVVGLAVLVFWG